MNAAFAADRSKVTNERCSRINAAPYHNNAASTRGFDITKNAVQLGNKNNVQTISNISQY